MSNILFKQYKKELFIPLLVGVFLVMGFITTLWFNSFKVSATIIPIAVNVEHLDFGTVFPGENLQGNFIVSYTQEQGEGINYRIIQKRKPLPPEHPEYPNGGDPEMPGFYKDLCSFLTKVSIEEEGDTETQAFVGPSDTTDTWIIYFKVPAIFGYVSQDHNGGIVTSDGEYGCDIAIEIETEGGNEFECEPGAQQQCDTGQMGICAVGIKTCSEEGFWGECQSVNEPVSEICNNGLDDDCDGDIDSQDSDCETEGGGGETLGGGGGSVVIYSLYIFNEESGTPDGNTVTVSWFTNLPSTSRVIYDTVSHPVLGDPPNYGYAFSTSEDSNKVTFHSMSIGGLEPDTTYYWRAVSHTSPNEVLGDERIFTTGTLATQGPILTPPQVPPPTPTPTIPSPIVPSEEITPKLSEEITREETPIAKKEKGPTQTGFEKFLAAIGGFFTLKNPCWVFFLGILMLVILFLLVKKKRKRTNILLIILVIIAIIFHWYLCYSALLILILVIALIILLISLFRKKWEEGEEK